MREGVSFLQKILLLLFTSIYKLSKKEGCVFMDRFVDGFIQYFSKNKYTFIFWGLMVLSAFSCIWLLYCEVVKASVPTSSVPSHLVKVMLDAMVLMSPFLLIKKRGLAFIWLVLIDLFCLSSVWYYRNYLDIIPFSSFLLYENLSPLLLKSTLASTRWVDFVALLPTLVTAVVYKLFLQKKVKEERRRLWWPFLLFGLFFIAFHCLLSVRDIKPGKYDNFAARFVTYPNSILYIDLHGVFGYTVYQIVDALLPESELTNDERANITHYFDTYPQYTDTLCPENKQKNLVLIIVESLNSWVIGKRFCDEEVTPCLNRIVNDSNSITALHVLPQVKDGRSSDGQFMFNTGLLPLRSGAVTTRYGDVDYCSIVKALKQRGYRAVNMALDKTNYWNQDGISVAYGYDEFINRQENEVHYNGNVPDSVLMTWAAEKIKAEKSPFIYQLVTITSHMPYDKPYRRTALSKATEFPEEIRNYMEVIRYTDSCIGMFIDSLQANGLYENTVIAIASDHNQLLTPCDIAGYNDTEAAFIVANAGVKHTHEEVMGQIDIYPTLLDVMGCNDYAWKGLGYSILRTPVRSAAGWNGQVYGDPTDSLVSRQIEAWEISEQMISGGYFDTKQ